MRFRRSFRKPAHCHLVTPSTAGLLRAPRLSRNPLLTLRTQAPRPRGRDCERVGFQPEKHVPSAAWLRRGATRGRQPRSRRSVAVRSPIGSQPALATAARLSHSPRITRPAGLPDRTETRADLSRGAPAPSPSPPGNSSSTPSSSSASPPEPASPSGTALTRPKYTPEARPLSRRRCTSSDQRTRRHPRISIRGLSRTSAPSLPL